MMPLISILHSPVTFIINAYLYGNKFSKSVLLIRHINMSKICLKLKLQLQEALINNINSFRLVETELTWDQP